MTNLKEIAFSTLWLLWLPFALFMSIPLGYFGTGKFLKIVIWITLPIWYPCYLIMGGWQDFQKNH